MEDLKVLNKIEEVNEFEYVSSSKKDFNLPSRSTSGSAGYDFYSPIDCVVNPGETKEFSLEVKCKIKSNEFLMIVPRSSMGFKGDNFITMTNTLGIIDRDYYNNKNNEGCISLKIHNFGEKPFKIAMNDRLVQGIFLKFDLTKDDCKKSLNSSNVLRVGGLGSTGR